MSTELFDRDIISLEDESTQYDELSELKIQLDNYDENTSDHPKGENGVLEIVGGATEPSDVNNSLLSSIAMEIVDELTTEEENPKFDFVYKILTIGNSGVGKTAFVIRYCKDSFNPAFFSTVGIDFQVKTLVRKDKRVKLQIWDTAGQERYQSLTTAYYHGAMGFILMFDLTNNDSFEACRAWFDRTSQMNLENPVIILVGNKLDLTSEREVDTQKIDDLSASLGIQYFETSAKTNTNIKECMEHLVDAIMQKMSDRTLKQPAESTSETDNGSVKRKTCSC
jgi:small GTP-binding protein